MEQAKGSAREIEMSAVVLSLVMGTNTVGSVKWMRGRGGLNL